MKNFPPDTAYRPSKKTRGIPPTSREKTNADTNLGVSRKTALCRDKKDAKSAAYSSAWELALIEMFVRASMMLGLRKSVGMVYGALYCAEAPLSVRALEEKLRLSHGSVVEALLLLRRFNSVHTHLKIGERQDYFSAETDFNVIMHAVLKEVLQPALTRVDVCIRQADASVCEEDSSSATFARSRIRKLARWQACLAETFPHIEDLLQK